MKGIVFKEFIGLSEKTFGVVLTEKVIQACSLESQGAYSGVGTYNHSEMIRLVTVLSQETRISVPDLLKSFGQHLAVVFAKGHPGFFKQPNVFEFLKSIENVVHSEVRKLYPDAELPHFEYQEIDKNTFVFIYRSQRPFADLAEGLIQGAIIHYQEDIEIKTMELSGGEPNSRIFKLTRRIPYE